MNGRYRSLKVAGVVFAIAACGLVVKRLYQSEQTELQRHVSWPEGLVPGVVPGEFERQEALALCWGMPMPESVDAVFAKIVTATWNKIQIVILVRNSLDQRHVVSVLSKAGVPVHTVRFVQVPFDSLWIRDYGPIGLEDNDGGGRWIDSNYSLHKRFARDNLVPSALARSLRMPVVRVPILLPGGAMLTNGDGLFITTEWLLKENAHRGHDKAHVMSTLRTVCGAKQVIYLENLAGELTGHVDMFATFTATDTVVVGEFPSARLDNNAAILDRNAKRLAGVKTSAGPLKVVRIPMPPRGQQIWGGTYTNVVYANGTILVPTYGDIDLRGEAKAMATFRRLLPDWNVVGIDARPLIMQSGALHCATLNLFRINPADKPPAL